MVPCAIVLICKLDTFVEPWRSNGGVHRRGISNTATLLLAFDNSVTLVYQRLPAFTSYESILLPGPTGHFLDNRHSVNIIYTYLCAFSHELMSPVYFFHTDGKR